MFISCEIGEDIIERKLKYLQNKYKSNSKQIEGELRPDNNGVLNQEKLMRSLSEQTLS